MARVRYMQHAGGSYSAVVVLGAMSVVAAEHSSLQCSDTSNMSASELVTQGKPTVQKTGSILLQLLPRHNVQQARARDSDSCQTTRQAEGCMHRSTHFMVVVFKDDCR